ncbi:TPA: hypothetical protein QCI71_004444 [Enterobacter chuandaensis]|uniref:hypothetical protein n=1 Tax=Enterobacter nematophilus TaxID=2994648 RepID=UPI0032FED7BF|nr:hypothetical protein [Enterobacter chuandaensis]
MKSKRIYYRVKGHDDETYIFLDKHDDGSLSVRSGNSTHTSHFTWDGEEEVESVEEFLASNPSYQGRVEELIAEFNTEEN